MVATRSYSEIEGQTMHKMFENSDETWNAISRSESETAWNGIKDSVEGTILLGLWPLLGQMSLARLSMQITSMLQRLLTQGYEVVCSISVHDNPRNEGSERVKEERDSSSRELSSYKTKSNKLKETVPEK